ncbi:hypothetical protein HZS_2663 [Henneguya salminicola]|nr:hypothetical protein HZS_2663 [Henneguya salminicola]
MRSISQYSVQHPIEKSSLFSYHRTAGFNQNKFHQCSPVSSIKSSSKQPTFFSSTTPNPFYQCLIIMVYDNASDFYIPCVSVLWLAKMSTFVVSFSMRSPCFWTTIGCQKS